MSQEERSIWEGHPSHIKDLGFHIAVFVFTIGVGFPFMIWRWLETRCRRYDVSSERIQLTRGVLSKRIDELELYRVKDTSIDQPIFLRLFGLANLVIKTSDKSTPTLTLEAIPEASVLRENLRGCIEKLRAEKGVREIDYS